MVNVSKYMEFKSQVLYLRKLTEERFTLYYLFPLALTSGEGKTALTSGEGKTVGNSCWNVQYYFECLKPPVMC